MSIKSQSSLVTQAELSERDRQNLGVGSLGGNAALKFSESH